MIDNPYPDKWQDLQLGVKRIFRNVGLSSDIEVNIPTPRGSVNVDVFAIDGLSLDNIKYIVECKNWSSAIPQSVVHSFTTIMHETGANIGFIISKRGLQSGAEEYTRSTNIVGLTYLEFQQRYFEAWWTRYFCPRVGDAADRILQYTEEFGSYRDSEYNKLSKGNRDLFDQLRSEYRVSSFMLAMFNAPSISPMLDTGTLLNPPSNLKSFKIEVLSKIIPGVTWYGSTFRELLEGILQYFLDAEESFNSIFGRYIFDRTSISGVGEDGPSIDVNRY